MLTAFRSGLWGHFRRNMAHSLENYPVFAPPFDLPDRRHTMWSRADAERYFEWFMSVKDHRIAWAHEFLALSPEVRGEQKIRQLDESIERMDCRPWKQESGMIPIAYSPGVDVGLLFADTIEGEAGEGVLWWAIDEPKEKLYISYRLPTLHGFENGLALDPVLVGTNTLLRVVVDDQPPDLVAPYRTWCGWIPDA